MNSRVKNNKNNISISQLKLAVALELKAEGYDTIIFDRVISAHGRKMKVHVYCEDEVGTRIAVLCLNKSEDLKPGEVFETVEFIESHIEDCRVALALPIALLPRACEIIGLTGRVYLVDFEGRVWVHDHHRRPHTEILVLPADEGVENYDADRAVEARDFYIA
jgi:hypothetical protein